MVKNDRAGKKCIGIAKPGNISGLSIVRGNCIPKTPTILAKLRTEIRILIHGIDFSPFHL
jgi:hypothetical protein